MTTRAQQERELLLLREMRIRKARKDLWEYCKTRAPEFYKEEHWHLKMICRVLQALYERRLTKAYFRQLCDEFAPSWYINTVDWDRLHEDKVYEKMQMSIPPRHGKSRTLVMFTAWCFGIDNTNRVITSSYADDQAQEFSRFTRDEISEEKVFPHEILYEDIFPGTKISQDNSSYQKWALEGQFFSYKGAGIGGQITGKGANIMISDDLVKDAEQAFNENTLDKIWQWYTGTWLSRGEQRGDLAPIEIVNMTRWSKKDVCGRILDGAEADEWFLLIMEAFYDIDGGTMLCKDLLNRKRYESLKKNVEESIFLANYHQKPVDQKGKLYKSFKTYEDIPRNEHGHPLFERILSYTDTADEGSDWLCSVVGGVYQGEIYVLDVYYSQAGMEETEPQTADFFVRNNVTIAKIESNNGGRGFARNVEKLVWERHNTKKVAVQWFHQTGNKHARIMTASTFVMNHMYFPVNWRDKWPEYYKAMNEYQKEGKNKHDDAPDATTGLVEMIDVNPWAVFLENQAKELQTQEPKQVWPMSR